jgi:predicted dehydrogenase
VEACRANGVKFGAGDMFRNLAQIWKAREIIESGEIGKVQSINYYGSGDSGGGCQTLSMLRFFAWDADVDFVVGWTNGTPMDSSLGKIDARSDHDQQLGGVIRFANGITAHIHDKPVVRHGIEVVCENGVFTSDYKTFSFYKRPDGKQANHRNWSELEEIEGLLAPSREFGPFQDDGWQRMSDRQSDTAQSMIDALDQDIEPRATGDNGRNVLELSIALRESERRGFAPVKLPLEDRNLQIIPAASRMFWKKEVYGEEWYADQMVKHKRGSTYGA